MSGLTELPRKVTAVGTMGDVNQLFTVYEKNWNCPDCGQENYATRPKCSRCRKQKPQGVNNLVMDEGMVALQQGKAITWQEIVDPNTYQIYYYNIETGATQWERPAEMGAAPMATGWFGRGKAGSLAAQLYAEANKQYLTKSARRQKEFIDPKRYHLEGANEFNIWYGKFSGDYQDKKDREPALDRCVLATDAGYTKADLADKNEKEAKKKRYFCLHFAHGICTKGAECTFYHRIPLPEDAAKIDEMVDCFGRARHNKHKEDMTGTGSFLKPCRTLFVGSLLKHKYDTSKDMEDALWRHFGEWGEVESINVIYRLSICFPRYRLRCSAEFAKEAMSQQSLDKGEILTVRWAHDDPNPVAQDSISRADKDAMVALLKSKGISLAQTGFEYPADYQVPDAKRARTGEVDPQSAILQQHPELAYPNTDAQFREQAAVAPGPWSEGYVAATSAEAPTMTMTPEEYAAYCQQYYAAYFAQQDQEAYQGTEAAAADTTAEKGGGKVESKPADGDAEEESENKDGGEDAESDEEDDDDEVAWKEYVDQSTGATYYFNSQTGESSWTKPADM